MMAENETKKNEEPDEQRPKNSPSQPEVQKVGTEIRGLSSFLQTSSQALVIVAGLAYLSGFIIISVFDASYGIADFSLVRTKVIAVGGLFVLLLSLPVIVTFRMFGMFGLQVTPLNICPLLESRVYDANHG